jgi:hypothetical protein
MKLISHRGNIDGKQINEENKPDYIKSALEKGFDVEIDVWYKSKNWYLGHDEPQYETNYNFLLLNNLWIHAKNGDAFYKLLQNSELNVFWHTNEDWILTSKGYIWTFPNKILYPNSICVLPELGYVGELDKCYGICSDYVLKYKNYE